MKMPLLTGLWVDTALMAPDDVAALRLDEITRGIAALRIDTLGSRVGALEGLASHKHPTIHTPAALPFRPDGTDGLSTPLPGVFHGWM